MSPLCAALLLWASSASAQSAPAQKRLDGTAAMSESAAVAPDDGQAKDGGNAAFDGGAPNGDAVGADGRSIQKGIPLRPATAALRPAADAPPPPAKEMDGRGRVSSGLMLAGAAALGGLQGWFAAGVVGLAAGAALGLGAAWLFRKGDYGGAFGMTAGAIIGTALGGPIGGLIGAAAGGLVGHFLGKLFL